MKIKIYCNLKLVISYILLLSIYTFMVLGILYVIDADNVKKTEDLIYIRMIFLILLLSLYVCVVSVSSRIFDYIILDEKCITYKSPFKKSYKNEYKSYRYIYIGSYIHVVKRVYFIVISKYPIKKNVLMEINQFKSSGEAFKIKYSEKTYHKIIRILPHNMVNRLNVEIQKAIVDV